LYPGGSAVGRRSAQAAVVDQGAAGADGLVARERGFQWRNELFPDGRGVPQGPDHLRQRQVAGRVRTGRLGRQPEVDRFLRHVQEQSVRTFLCLERGDAGRLLPAHFRGEHHPATGAGRNRGNRCPSGIYNRSYKTAYLLMSLLVQKF